MKHGPNEMTDRFTGRTALVTGASRGIGFSVAQRLLSEGARVCITGRKEQALADAAQRLAAPGRLLISPGSVNDETHLTATFDLCAAEFGTLDVLINNVGVNPKFGDLLALDTRGQEQILGSNLLGPVNWTRGFMEVGGVQSGRSIVNVSSVAGVRPAHGIGFYGVSKAALIQLTQQLAFELAPNVRVNSVAPAVVETRFSAVLYEGKVAEVARNYPMGRLGTPDDISAAVAFLASSDASWITGQTLIVDGGLTLSGGI